jgi:hypothetical protein
MKKKQMLDLFMSATAYLTPHNHESEMYSLLPSDAEYDEMGNAFVLRGSNRVAFTCHLDTVGIHAPVNRIIEGRFVRTDGNTQLGADDKAGLVIMLGMLDRGVEGLYCFFVGEECGCVGSAHASDHERFTGTEIMISLDRKGYSDIITSQSFGIGTSQAFVDSLSQELAHSRLFMSESDGVYTDSNEFFGTISECTNLSVGYFGHHTLKEVQDWWFLYTLTNALCDVNQNRLVAERKPEIVQRYHCGYYGDWYGKSDYSAFSARKTIGTITRDPIGFYEGVVYLDMTYDGRVSAFLRYGDDDGEVLHLMTDEDIDNNLEYSEQDRQWVYYMDTDTVIYVANNIVCEMLVCYESREYLKSRVLGLKEGEKLAVYDEWSDSNSTGALQAQVATLIFGVEESWFYVTPLETTSGKATHKKKPCILVSTTDCYDMSGWDTTVRNTMIGGGEEQ